MVGVARCCERHYERRRGDGEYSISIRFLIHRGVAVLDRDRRAPPFHREDVHAGYSKRYYPQVYRRCALERARDRCYKKPQPDMCNLYADMALRKDIVKSFGITSTGETRTIRQPAIFPGHDALVVRPDDKGERELMSMSWGYVLHQ